MLDFFHHYFTGPIVEKTGYNWINTLAYAAIAILALFLIYKAFKKYKIEIDKTLFIGVLLFVLFGTGLRVLSDAKDSGILPTEGIYNAISSGNFYGYGFLTVTPGIYLLTAAAFLISLIISYKVLKNKKYLWVIGGILAFSQIALLLPLIKHFEIALIILAMAAVPFLLAWRLTKEKKLAAIVGSQALDGAATFAAASLAAPGYKTVGVAATMFGSLDSSYMLFYAVKILIASCIVYFLYTDKEHSSELRTFIAIAVTTIGLAPGLHDLLRVAVGA